MNVSIQHPNPPLSPRAAVIGWPIEHSLSPRLHQYWLNLYGIKGNYEKIAVAPPDLAATLANLAANSYRGVNLTVPHKEPALKLVDNIEPLARRVGAINTVVVQDDGSLLGRNTDVFGFTENLRSHGFVMNNGCAVIVGAGGAARAALVALLGMGARDIRIINRTLDRATALVREFAHELGGDPITSYAWDDDRALAGADLLVNATSLGLKGQPPLTLSLDHLPLDATVTDMVYAPLKTDLLIRAANRGHAVIDGLGMLLHQARPAFQAFFGRDPEVTPELRAHVLSALG